ncbi:thermolabile L-asparaginase [Nemania sp. FL0916]|nr:thermolabile L-asparaginase [Nemania sp. FL0916]
MMDQDSTTLPGYYVVSDREGIVENRHFVNAAVVDASGKLLFVLGNPSRMTLIRSGAKAMQAIAAVESGTMEKFDFDDADLALMCGSHNSEARHISRAKAMLAKLQAEESDLQCCGHTPFSAAVAREWTRSGFEPSPACSACSGNHIGVMAAAKAIGADIADYHTLDHPVQARIQTIVKEVTGLGSGDVKWALDGCNMYSPAMPLRSVAAAWAAFAKAADDVADGNGGVQTAPRMKAMARIYGAMARHPENVGGDGRFCTVLGRVYEGALVGKAGGDGCYGIAIRASEDTRRLGAEGGIGIALKIEDGNYGIMEALASELLEQLQIGTEEVRQHLNTFHKGEIRSTNGLVTGGLSFPFKLRAV